MTTVPASTVVADGVLVRLNSGSCKRTEAESVSLADPSTPDAFTVAVLTIDALTVVEQVKYQALPGVSDPVTGDPPGASSGPMTGEQSGSVRVTVSKSVSPSLNAVIVYVTVSPGNTSELSATLPRAMLGLSTLTSTESKSSQVTPSESTPVTVATLVMSSVTTTGPQVYCHVSPGSSRSSPSSPETYVTGEHWSSLTTIVENGSSPVLLTSNVKVTLLSPGGSATSSCGVAGIASTPLAVLTIRISGSITDTVSESVSVSVAPLASTPPAVATLVVVVVRVAEQLYAHVSPTSSRLSPSSPEAYVTGEHRSSVTATAPSDSVAPADRLTSYEYTTSSFGRTTARSDDVTTSIPA